MRSIGTPTAPKMACSIGDAARRPDARAHRAHRLRPWPGVMIKVLDQRWLWRSGARACTLWGLDGRYVLNRFSHCQGVTSDEPPAPDTRSGARAKWPLLLTCSLQGAHSERG